MFNENFTSGVMNIHFIQSHNSYAGKARWPGGAKSFVCMITTNSLYHLTGVLAHEVGHALDLLHTHQGRPWGNNGDKSNCYQEAVSRAKIQPVGCGNFTGAKKCERNGDRLCDTEADPGLQETHVTLDFNAGTATYNNGGQDNWGDPWAPDVRNVMSYSPPGARETFTGQQAGVMAWWISAVHFPAPNAIDIGLNYIPLNNNNAYVDIYEPDNQMENASTIEIGTTQHRGLHRSYSQNRYAPTIETCDLDWILLELPGNTNRKISIFTEGVIGKPEPDTEIFLYESDGTTLIANNDDISSSNSFSKLSEIELSPGNYYIAVRGNGNTYGEYYISAEYCQASCCFQPLLEGISELLQGGFNLGVVNEGVEEYIGGSLDVYTALFFNSDVPVGFAPGPLPPMPSTLQGKVCNNAEITIKPGAIMVVGNNNGLRNAELTFTQGSKLNIDPGASLYVTPNSKLIIEDGAKLSLKGGQMIVSDNAQVIIKQGGLLIYEAGTYLELNGNDAQLALGGHTHIGDDATFRFFWEGNEGGYVRLLEEAGTGERFSAGTNARIHLRGDGKDDLILYMENGTALWEYGTGVNIPDYPTLNSNYFERVLLSYGKVELENNAKIKLAKDGRFHGVHMQSFGAGGAHDVEAFRRCDILDSDLFNMRVQANLHILNTGRLAVSASNFYGGTVVVRGRYYQVDNSYFFQSSINSVDGSLASSVNYCEFDQCDYAVTDLSVATLNVNGSHFHNGFGGIEKGLGPLNLKCNEFNDLNVAVLGYAKARVNLSTFHGAGYNHFWNNPVNIQLSYATDISLDWGYNQIYDGSSTVSNIEGILAHNSSIMCPPLGIAASHNTWTPHSAGGGPGYPDPNKFNVASHGGSGSSLLVCPRAFHFGVVAPVTACGEHDGPIRDPLEKSGTAKSAGQVILPLITSDTYYQEIPLDEAIHMAMASSTLVDSLDGNNLVAADMFYELLHAEIEMSAPVNDSLTAAVASLRWQALSDYKGLVEYLFADSTLSIDANQSVFDLTIGNYTSTLMHLTDSVKTETNYLYQFELEMLKAGLFRSINKPEMAYAILANVDFCEHDSLERAVLIVMLENIAYDISMQQYSLSEIMHASGSFELDSALLAAIVPSAIDTSAFGSYFADPEYVWFTNCGTWGQEKKKITSNLPASLMTIYPNPASSVLELQFGEGLDFNKGLFEFRLFDLGGKHLLTAPLQGATQMLQLPRLQSALYLGVVYQNGVAIHQEKVNIIQ